LDKTSGLNLFKKLPKFEFFLLVTVSFSIFLAIGSPGKSTPYLYSENIEEIDELSSTSVYFDNEIESLNRTMALSAKKSIKIATYTFSDSGFSRLLKKRYEDGIEIKVVAGRNKNNVTPGYPFFHIERDRGIVHPKFMVIDSKDVVITSSNMASNLSTSSNNAVFFRDVPIIAKILEEEIDSLFINKIEKRCPQGCETEIGTVYFTPGGACRAIRDEFMNAENTINGAVYTLTLRHPVITGLKRALKNGVKVSLIVDNWIGRENKKVNKGAERYLQSLGAAIDFDNDVMPGDPLFHHKFAVIDKKTTIFGSMNWTASGCYRNREIVVVNRDFEIAKAFDDYFNEIR
jgi:phosphatidylserine/phosphatidylglycerophosphate/cardiolipin synthase-like enzyme